MELIQYECLRCGETWDRPEEQEPVAACPGCNNFNWDKEPKAESECVICGVMYERRQNGHSSPSPVCGSTKCQSGLKVRKKKRGGLGI